MLSNFKTIDAIIEEFSSLVFPRNLETYKSFKKLENPKSDKQEKIQSEGTLTTELTFFQESLLDIEEREEREDSIFKLLEEKWWQTSSELFEFSGSF